MRNRYVGHLDVATRRLFQTVVFADPPAEAGHVNEAIGRWGERKIHVGVTIAEVVSWLVCAFIHWARPVTPRRWGRGDHSGEWSDGAAMEACAAAACRRPLLRETGHASGSFVDEYVAASCGGDISSVNGNVAIGDEWREESRAVVMSYVALQTQSWLAYLQDDLVFAEPCGCWQAMQFSLTGGC